jgi:hypothetical protein
MRDRMCRSVAGGSVAAVVDAMSGVDANMIVMDRETAI